MKFFSNLRPQTIDAFTKLGVTPDGYLLSTHRATPSALRYALNIRAQGIELIADNGTKEHIESVLKQFSASAKEINQELSAIRRTLGRMPKGRSIPKLLRDKAKQLASTIVDECTRRSDAIDTDALITAQLAMQPTHLIAQEDFAIACLTGLGLERYVTGWRISKIEQRNRRSIRLYETVANDPRCQTVKVFAVLSAMDYNSAKAASFIAANAGIKHVALGMVGIMRDSRSTNTFVLHHSNYKLPHAVARRYARFAEIVLGLQAGYKQANAKMESFHALGLGAAPMLPFLFRAMNQVPAVTLDASSPIQDAVKSRVLYEHSKAADRVSCQQIVQRIVEGGEWKLDTPFLKSFCTKFNHDTTAAQNWWEANGKPKINNDLLSNVIELQSSLPLFTRIDSDIKRAARLAHVAHNHFVISKLAAKLHAGPNMPQEAETLTEQMLQFHSTIIKHGITAMKYIFQKVN